MLLRKEFENAYRTYPTDDDQTVIEVGTLKRPFLGEAMNFNFSNETDANKAIELVELILEVVDNFFDEVTNDFNETFEPCTIQQVVKEILAEKRQPI